MINQLLSCKSSSLSLSCLSASSCFVSGIVDSHHVALCRPNRFILTSALGVWKHLVLREELSVNKKEVVRERVQKREGEGQRGVKEIGENLEKASLFSAALHDNPRVEPSSVRPVTHVLPYLAQCGVGQHQDKSHINFTLTRASVSITTEEPTQVDNSMFVWMCVWCCVLYSEGLYHKSY